MIEAGAMRECCGIVGISLSEGNSSLPIYYGLYALQHRGQESAGIAVCENGEINVLKGMGLVYEVFDEKKLELLRGNAGIGHVRYSTTGASRIENAQPLVLDFKGGSIAIAHNGNLVNTQELRRELEREGRVFHTDCDSEVIAQLLVKELMRHDLLTAIKEIMLRLRGSYSLVMLVNDALVAVRDPLGFRPLCIGELDSGYIVASETAAIDVLGGRFLQDVKPGEVVIFKDGELLERHRLYKASNTAHCVFEYIYFARADSVLDGRLVYDVRLKIGERLAEEHPIEADIVTPVPDSGVTFAIGYARRSGIPYMEGFIKNRYVGRTFIMPEQRMRDVAVRLKLNVVRKNVEDRRVVVVDDSIVRGTTSRRIVNYIRRGGAREVHFRIGSPPIIAPCYMGIDMSTREELIAANHDVDEICRLIEADTLGYLSLEGLIDAIGMPARSLCLGCLTGRYPIEIPGEVCILRQLTLSQF